MLPTPLLSPSSCRRSWLFIPWLGCEHTRIPWWSWSSPPSLVYVAAQPKQQRNTIQYNTTQHNTAQPNPTQPNPNKSRARLSLLLLRQRTFLCAREQREVSVLPSFLLRPFFFPFSPSSCLFIYVTLRC